MTPENDTSNAGWVGITKWPGSYPSTFQLKAMIARAEERTGRPPEWARRLPSGHDARRGRWLVNPAVFWRWLDEAQAANQSAAELAPRPQAQAAPCGR